MQKKRKGCGSSQEEGKQEGESEEHDQMTQRRTLLE